MWRLDGYERESKGCMYLIIFIFVLCIIHNRIRFINVLTSPRSLPLPLVKDNIWERQHLPIMTFNLVRVLICLREVCFFLTGRVQN